MSRRSPRSIVWQCDFFPSGEQELAVRVLMTQVSVLIADGQPSPVPLPRELISHLDDVPGAGMTESGGPG